MVQLVLVTLYLEDARDAVPPSMIFTPGDPIGFSDSPTR